MALPSEIKIFTKNTLIAALFFALALELSWDYIGPMLGLETNAGSNATKFQQVEVNYMGNTATALSLAVWNQRSLLQNWSNIISGNSIITISEVLANPEEGQRRLIWTHMQSIQTYINIMETDIPALLTQSTDRATTIDEHIALLKHYGNKTNDSLMILDEQITDLRAIISKNTEDTNQAKWTLQSSLSSLEYNGIDTAIDTYTKAKNTDTYARIYLIYLERFRDSYQKLQAKNKTILTTLADNRDAIIKKTIIVIPTTGSDMLKELWIIQSEAEYKAQKTLN